jgi:hypothetical protein
VRVSPSRRISKACPAGQHGPERLLDRLAVRSQQLDRGAPEVLVDRPSIDAGQRGVDADVAQVGVEEGQARRRPGGDPVEQRAVLEQRAIALEVAGDADERAPAARRVAGGAPLHRQPAHRTVGRDHADLELVGGIVLERGRDRRPQPLAVIGVHEGQRDLVGGRHVAQVDAHDRRQRARPPHRARVRVDPERAGATGVQRQLELGPGEALQGLGGGPSCRVSGQDGLLARQSTSPTEALGRGARRASPSRRLGAAGSSRRAGSAPG